MAGKHGRFADQPGIDVQAEAPADGRAGASLRETAINCRAALNHASVMAFVNGKMSHGLKLQSLVYKALRSRFSLSSQVACNAPRQVLSTYKTLLERAGANSVSIIMVFTPAGSKLVKNQHG